MKNPEVIRKKGLSEQKIIMINRRLPNIIVPKNKQSLDLLFENNDMDSDYMIFPVGREDLNELFKTGIFDRMNERLNIIIDTYEEEEIIGRQKIEEAKSILTEFNEYKDPVLKYYFDSLGYLLTRAAEFDTAVLFYF